VSDPIYSIYSRKKYRTLIWRSKVNKYFLAAFALPLFGCASPAPSNLIESSRAITVQLQTAPDGRVYRIETQTGKTSWLDGSIFRTVSEPTMPQLVIGKVYRGEDGTTTYRYEGTGKLEKWGLERYNTNPPKDAPPQK